MEEPITDLLDQTLKSMGIRAAVRDAQVRDVFAEVVGAALGGHCRAERVERGTLVIASANSALAHQLQMDSPRVIAAINARLGAEVVKRFRFVTLDPRD